MSTIKCNNAYTVCEVVTNYDFLTHYNSSNSLLFRKVKIMHHRISYLWNSKFFFFVYLVKKLTVFCVGFFAVTVITTVTTVTTVVTIVIIRGNVKENKDITSVTFA